MRLHIIFLISDAQCIKCLSNLQLGINRCHSLINQHIAVNLNGISALTVDALPQLLKFLLFKILIVELVFNGCLITVSNHILKRIFIIQALNQHMYSRLNILKLILHRLQSTVGGILLIFFGDSVIIVKIIMSIKIFHYLTCLLAFNFISFIANLYYSAEEVLYRYLFRTFIQSFFDFILQAVDKIGIAFTGNNRQFIDHMHISSANAFIHALTLLIDADTHATADFLSLVNIAVGLLQGTDLENIGVIPAFTQRGVREYKTHRIIKA